MFAVTSHNKPVASNLTHAEAWETAERYSQSHLTTATIWQVDEQGVRIQIAVIRS